MRKPSPLQRGDLIGVVAPGAAVDPQALDRGLATLRAAGFEVREGAALRERRGYLAGDDAQRAADLESMLADPDIKAIIAARGGYGCGRLLGPRSFFERDAPPKIFAGHSDVTFLLNDALDRAGLVTFHSPMVAGLESGSATTNALIAALTNDSPPTCYPGERIRSGLARGRLVGGCLSVVTAMIGTPYAVDPRGRVLFLEDVNEKPFRIDRMLTHLWQAGAFDGVEAVVFGEMVGCSAGANEAVRVHDVIEERFAHASFPVLYGIPSGHGVGSAILPIGVEVEVDGDRMSLLESPFVW